MIPKSYISLFSRCRHIFDFLSLRAPLSPNPPRLKLHSLLLITTLSSTLALAATPKPEALEAQIQKRGSRNFEALIHEWEDSYGAKAVPPLLTIAKNTKKTETDRYIALMGAAKLGGAGLISELQGFLKDHSWMLRSGALRLLAVLGSTSQEVGRDILNSLDDPALVVRTEAVETVRALKMPGAADALFKAVKDPANYHRGRALWVPQKALYALVDLGAVEIAPKLSQFIHSPERPKDPQLIELAEKAIETLNRKASTSSAQ